MHSVSLRCKSSTVWAASEHQGGAPEKFAPAPVLVSPDFIRSKFFHQIWPFQTQQKAPNCVQQIDMIWKLFVRQWVKLNYLSCPDHSCFISSNRSKITQFKRLRPEAPIFWRHQSQKVCKWIVFNFSSHMLICLIGVQIQVPQGSIW